VASGRVRSYLRLAAICSLAVGLFLIVVSGLLSSSASSCVTAVDYCDDTSSSSPAGVGIFLAILAAPLAAGAVVSGSAKRDAPRRHDEDPDQTHQ
jgi:drug/metabolite transporter (DMT)-like permease